MLLVPQVFEQSLFLFKMYLGNVLNRTNRGEDGGEEENAPFIDASMFEDNEDDN